MEYINAKVIKIKGFTEYYAIGLIVDNIPLVLRVPSGFHYSRIGVEKSFPVDQDNDIIEDSEEYRQFFQRIVDKINGEG